MFSFQTGDSEDSTSFSDYTSNNRTLSTELWRYMRRPVDSAEKQYRCEYTGCGKSYYERKNLLQHQYLKHGRARVPRQWWTALIVLECKELSSSGVINRIIQFNGIWWMAVLPKFNSSRVTENIDGVKLLVEGFIQLVVNASQAICSNPPNTNTGCTHCTPQGVQHVVSWVWQIGNVWIIRMYW